MAHQLRASEPWETTRSAPQAPATANRTRIDVRTANTQPAQPPSNLNGLSYVTDLLNAFGAAIPFTHLTRRATRTPTTPATARNATPPAARMRPRLFGSAM